jgi:F420-non-reducing hydrogenase small subunit
MKTKILIKSLTSCGGCISSIIELEIFPDIFDSVEFIYFPLIKDAINLDKCDIALIEGCITRKDQIKDMKLIRRNSKKVICVGTCSIFGGISSMAKEIPFKPVNQIVDTDGFIPGCPAPPELLANSLMAILNDEEIILPKNNLCSECELRPENGLKPKVTIKKLLPDKPPNKCLLLENVLCLGPITRAGCKAKCIKSNMPCEGCMGTVSRDFTTNLINFLASLEVSDDLRTYEGLFFRFSRPDLPTRRLNEL